MPILTFTSGPFNGRKKYVLRQISTQQIINRGVQYPTTTDDSAIVGLDPDYEYLAMDQDLTPDYDPRIFSLVTSEARNDLTTPPTWHITFDTEKRPEEQIKAAITNAEAAKNLELVPTQRTLKLTVMGLGILFRQVKGLTLNAKEQAVLAELTAAYAAVDKHDTLVAAKFADVEAGNIPVIDEWEG